LKSRAVERVDMATEERDAERVTVQTYVPTYQRERWEREADELDMSRAEYVRSMVQAGRRSFDLGGDAEEGPSDRSDPRGQGLEDRVLAILESEGHCDWDELVAGLTDDVEDRLDEALDELQAVGRVRHSGRHGGYTVVEDGE
jgi:hypothetical protein